MPNKRAAIRQAAGLVVGLVLLVLLAGCGGSGTSNRQASRHYQPNRYYLPPGSSNDPWGPYIHEASGRFGVPEQWIRAVMRQESGGQQDVISWAGAMGLMQVMPDTYDDLRGRYSLSDDPFDPHNNILAGAAYLREMYDRYGSPGFLAAYNAGPNRLDSYLHSGVSLPDETVNYVASIAPRLGPGTPMSGPLMVYAGGGPAGSGYGAALGTPSGCDPDAAYNPQAPCAAASAPAIQPAVLQTAPAVAQTVADASASSGCDTDAAYDPDRPCQPRVAVTRVATRTGYGCDPNAAFDPDLPCQPSAAMIGTQTAAPAPFDCNADAAFDPDHPCQSRAPAAGEPAAMRSAMVARSALPPVRVTAPMPRPADTRRPIYASTTMHRPVQESMALPAAYRTGPPAGGWAVQVGAYGTLSAAETAADRARALAPDLLSLAKIVLPATTASGNKVAFRARLTGLTPSAAARACSRLSARGLSCITVPPSSP